MLKTLRYDFYKIFKSKTMLGTFVASVCLVFLDALLLWYYYPYDTSVCMSLNSPMILMFLPTIFVSLFACKDFHSKFVRNFFSEYSLKDKICYVLSKAVCIFAVNFIWYALFFLSYYALISLRCHGQNVPLVFEYMSFDGTIKGSVSEGILNYFGVIMNAFAIEMVVLFLSVLIKKELFIVAGVFLYMFVSYPLYGELNGIFNWTYGFESVEWFTVFGMQDILRKQYYSYKYFNAINVTAVYTQSILVSLGYSVLFGFFSCLVVVKKKNY